MSVALVSSKTRVASLKKQLTVPKLELSAALLTTKLVKSVAKDLKIPVTHLYAWSDSAIVLGWLNNSTSHWKVFVSNRVTQILDVISSSQWRHVPTKENPADHASRGLLPHEILHCHGGMAQPGWNNLHLPGHCLLLLTKPHSCQK